MPTSPLRRRLYQRFAKLHGAVLLRTNGRPHVLGPGLRALVLETTGRRTGQRRAVPLLYLPHGDDFVVLASNYGQEHAPAWWLNLQAAPDAHVRWKGRRLAVRARAVEGDERAALEPRVRDHGPHWGEYLAELQREVHIVLLERR